MKLHLLLLFLLAAPVISRVLSFESTAPSGTPTPATSCPTPSASTATATPVPAPLSGSRPATSALPRIPASHAFTFM